MTAHKIARSPWVARSEKGELIRTLASRPCGTNTPEVASILGVPMERAGGRLQALVRLGRLHVARDESNQGNGGGNPCVQYFADRHQMLVWLSVPVEKRPNMVRRKSADRVEHAPRSWEGNGLWQRAPREGKVPEPVALRPLDSDGRFLTDAERKRRHVEATRSAVVPPHVKVQVCPSPTHDARWELSPAEKAALKRRGELVVQWRLLRGVPA